MKTLILAFLLSTQASAASGSGNVSTIVQSGAGKNSATPAFTLPVSDLAKRVMMTAGDDNLVNGDYYTLGRQDGGGNQVASGKNRYCEMLNFSASNLIYIQFGYATAPVTNRDPGPPTGAVKFGGSSSSIFTGFALLSTGNTAGTADSVPIHVVFPSLSYPFIFVNGSTGAGNFNFILDCIEQ